MAQEGGTVHICSRKKENVHEAISSMAGLKVHGHVCDVGDKGQR